jgi:DNA-binding transcriptional LysR family regulator
MGNPPLTGARLFERFRDGYAATAAGDAMATVAARLAEEVLALERRLAGQDLRPSGSVRLATTDTLGLAVVMPHLAAFQQAYPEIRLELAITNGVADLTHRDADVALRPTPDPPATLMGRRLAAVAYAIYGAPEYLSRHRGTEWSTHDWIGREDALGSTVAARWMRENVPEERIACRLDAVSVMHEAARAGMGLVVLPCYFGDGAPGSAALRKNRSRTHARRCGCSPIAIFVTPRLFAPSWISSPPGSRRNARGSKAGSRPEAVDSRAAPG